MTLHLIKLCVGVSEVKELRAYQNARWEREKACYHITRMMPRDKETLLDGGSLYWVIGGLVRVRQSLKDIEEWRDKKGVRRCKLHFTRKLVLTRPQPRRPFQGWRYLKAEDAPPDLPAGRGGGEALPPKLQAELAALGLL